MMTVILNFTSVHVWPYDIVSLPPPNVLQSGLVSSHVWLLHSASGLRVPRILCVISFSHVMPSFFIQGPDQAENIWVVETTWEEKIEKEESVGRAAVPCAKATGPAAVGPGPLLSIVPPRSLPPQFLSLSNVLLIKCNLAPNIYL